MLIKKYFIVLSVAVTFLLGACDSSRDLNLSVLDDIRAKGELVVVTRNAPTTYYEWRDEYIGYEHDMTQSFARYLGVDVRYIVEDSLVDMLDAIDSGEAHVAAAGLTVTKERATVYSFGPVYQTVKQQVVCRRGGKKPKKVSDLIDVKLTVAAESSYVENLQLLKKKNPELNWLESEDLSTENLLEQVWLKEIECTIADSNIVSLNRRYYPELVVRFDISKPQNIAWLMPANAKAISGEMNKWFAGFKNDNGIEGLTALNEQYYGFIEVYDYVDTRKFVRQINETLPDYRSYFENEAGENNIDWTLIAAQAYQESHWRANARSPTGVRGIMMLTLTTAKEVGIENRLDPEQSIRGGTQYLAKLLKRIPKSVKGPDRIWFALAAYNVGMGHIYDARALAKRHGKNPDSWADIAATLPLLSQKKYYKTVKHGYARGGEPVRYVQRIRGYQDILIQNLNN